MEFNYINLKNKKKSMGLYNLYWSYLYKPNKDAIDYLNTCIMQINKKNAKFKFSFDWWGLKKISMGY